ncbi:hypothetical protein [Leuconostoc pseudomesenteroides]|uniref:hypothetical protein n=1 Tax=Leuconostoc pseudomesenteroides TaxID=33968 RepID=UPI0039E78A4F
MKLGKTISLVIAASFGTLALAPIGGSDASYIGTVINTVRASTNKNTGVDRVQTTYRELSVRHGYTYTTRVTSPNTATEYVRLTTYIYTVY